MTSLKCFALFAILGLSAYAAQAAPEAGNLKSPPDKPDGSPRVGIYDSRAVAIAYCGTDRHEAATRRLDESLENAERSGDATEIKKADRAVWEARKRLHRQGFSTYPVDDILAQIPKEIDRIKKEANVSVLISKWDKKALAKHPKAEKVDVSESLVDALKPNKRQRRYAMAMMKVKPIPPKQYEVILKKEAGEHY
jgi:hypothetical protein